MKHLKKMLGLIGVFLIFHITYGGDIGVDVIEVKNENTLSVTLSENPNLSVGNIDAEIAILSDVDLRGGFMKEGTANEVELLLEDPLLPNTNYSLLTLSGTDGNIDFTTPGGVEGFTSSNLVSTADQDIDSIEVVDDRTLTIRYRQDLTTNSFDYKLLAESSIAMIEKPAYETPELLIHVEPPFLSEQNYILMFIDMQDVSGEYLTFDTGIYDFTTPVMDVSLGEAEQSEGETIGQIEEEVSPENELGATEDTKPMPELNAAGDNVSLEKSVEDENTVEVVALNAEVTPDTGAATWVLILASLVINTFYYSARRKRLALA